MAEQKQYDFQGRKVLGQEIQFKTEKEDWSIYNLEDGTKVRIKTVIASIIRLNEYDPVNNPIYLVNGTPAIAMDIPENLKKKIHA